MASVTHPSEHLLRQRERRQERVRKQQEKKQERKIAQGAESKPPQSSTTATISRKQPGQPPRKNDQTPSTATAGSQPSKAKTRQFPSKPATADPKGSSVRHSLGNANAAYGLPSKPSTSSSLPKGKKQSQKPKALNFPIQETEDPAPSYAATLPTVDGKSPPQPNSETSIPEQESGQADLPCTYATYTVSIPATPKREGTQSSTSLQDQLPSRYFSNAEDSGIGQSYSALKSCEQNNLK